MFSTDGSLKEALKTFKVLNSVLKVNPSPKFKNISIGLTKKVLKLQLNSDICLEINQKWPRKPEIATSSSSSSKSLTSSLSSLSLSLSSPGELLMAMRRSLHGEAIGVCGGEARLAGLIKIIIMMIMMIIMIMMIFVSSFKQRVYFGEFTFVYQITYQEDFKKSANKTLEYFA